MKKRLTVLFTAIFIILSSFRSIAIERLTIPEINCESAIVMDATTGNVLYQKNADQKAYPASTTKILTAALAIEAEYETRYATVSDYAVKAIGINGSNAGLKPGERFLVSDLINMALVLSANDAANAIAEAVSGTTSKFADLMNSKVRSLGLQNTTFLNPVGLDVEDGYKGHMTTARDLAVIMRYASSFEEFRKIIGKLEYQIPRSNGARPVYKNTNQLLTGSQYKTDAYTVIGGKTGYTKAAKNVFTGIARNNDGIELIVVLMKSPDRTQMFDDAKNLFDYGFDLVRAQPVVASKGFYDIRFRGSEKVINQYYQRGIVTGDDKGAFDYSSPATREMFVKVLMDVLEKKPANSSWNTEAYLRAAIKERLVDETWINNKTMPVTRGDVVRVLGKLVDLRLRDSDTMALALYFRDYDTMDRELRLSSLELCLLGIVPYINEGALNADKSVSREDLMLIMSRYEKILAHDAMNMLY